LAENAEAIATVLLHECMHCVMAHNERFKAIDPDEADHNVWNVCGDLAINEILDESQMPWTESVTPVRYSNYEDMGIDKSMITETAYATIKAWQQQNQGDERLGNQDSGSVTDNNSREYELEDDDIDKKKFAQKLRGKYAALLDEDKYPKKFFTVNSVSGKPIINTNSKELYDKYFKSDSNHFFLSSIAQIYINELDGYIATDEWND
jgi:predicted metal-dependent peptidase